MIHKYTIVFKISKLKLHFLGEKKKGFFRRIMFVTKFINIFIKTDKNMARR